MIIRMRQNPRRIGLGDVEYIPPAKASAEMKKVFSDYATASKKSVDDVKARFAKLRPQKDIAQEFEKSYQIAAKGAELASSWPNWNVFRKALPADKKAEIAKIKADLEETRSYWNTQARTKPTTVSRPGAKQQAMGVAPYVWVDWITKYTLVTTEAKAEAVRAVAKKIANAPSAAIQWAGDQTKKALGIPDWVFPVALGIGALVALAYGAKMLKTILPQKGTQ